MLRTKVVLKVVLCIVAAVSLSGCALAVGTVAGELGGALVGSTLEAGKTDTNVSCPSCKQLPPGVTRAEYERQMREEYRKKALGQ